MLPSPPPHLLDEIKELTDHQVPRVAPKRTCSIHRGGHCCLASPQFQDFIAGYTPGSSFVDHPEQQDSSSSSLEPVSKIDTASTSTPGSTMDVLTTATVSSTEEAVVSPAVALATTESASSSSSAGTMRTNLTTPDRSTKPISIMVTRPSTDTASSSLSPVLPPTNHSAPSLVLPPTSILSYSPTPVSTLASASHSLHDLPSSSSIAAATAFANLTPKVRRRTLDTFAADENAARRDWKATHPPYKLESRLVGGGAGNIRRVPTTGANGMSSYGIGHTSVARWGKLMDAARNEDDARAVLNSALNNQGTRPSPARRKMVQIYEPIKSSPLVPKPLPPSSPPPKESKQDTTADPSPPVSSMSPVSLSPAASLSTITTQSHNQTPPSIFVSFAEVDSTPATQQSPPLPPSSPTSATVLPEQPLQEVTVAVTSSALTLPPAPVPTLPIQTPQTASIFPLPLPSSPLAAPPIQGSPPSLQAVPTASMTTEVIPASTSPPSPIAAPSDTTLPTLPATTLPTPTNHVHLSRRTYTPPSKRTSLLSRLFSPFSSPHPNSSTSSHSSSVFQPPTFTSTKHPTSSTSDTGGGGLGRDITGTFVIDPLLVLPKGLFRMFSDDMFLGLSSTPTPSLEFIGKGRGGLSDGAGVESVDGNNTGGRLKLKRSRSFGGEKLPTSILNQSGQGAFSRHYHHGGVNGRSIAEVKGRGEKEEERKNLKLEVENGGMDIDVHIIPATTTNTAEGKSKRIQGMESEILKKRTTIELILLSATVNSHARGRGRRGQQMSEFHLTARIHAKGPRQPLHITARTYTPPPRLSSPYTNEMALTVPLGVPSQPPSSKIAASQSSSPAVLHLPPSPLSPPPPPPPSPPLLPSPPLPHPPTLPLPFSATTTPLITVRSDHPPSPTSSTYTTNTNQTAYTARTTITSTAPTLATKGDTDGGSIGSKRSGSTGRKLHRKRPYRHPKREPTLTPYYYTTAEEAAAAAAAAGSGSGAGDVGSAEVVGEGVYGVGRGVGECIGARGGGDVREEGEDSEETSAPPHYTRTHHSPSEAANHFPSDPYDAVNPPNSQPTRTPSTSSKLPVSASMPISASAFLDDNKDLKKSNSEKQQRKPPLPELDNSNLTLSLPRTFHGPLSIHVQAGNLDEHIELSDALQRECLLVREGGCARGLFVGDFRKKFGFDWGSGPSADGTDADGANGDGEEDVECVCGVGEGEKTDVDVGKEEERKVKRRPAVEFSTMTKTTANVTLHSDSEVSNLIYTTPQTTTTLHARTKSDSRSNSPNTNSSPGRVRSQSASSTLPFPTSVSSTDRPHRPSFLDVDPEPLIHKTNNSGSNGRGQVGWKTTKVQNMNGRVRVLSEHQSIMKSPLRNGQSQTPAWVLPKNELFVNRDDAGTVKKSIMLEGGDEDMQVRRLLTEKKVLSTGRGCEDDGPPTKMRGNKVGGGTEDDSSSGGDGGGGSGIEDIRRRRASAPVTPMRTTNRETKGKCTCGAGKTVVHSTNAGGQMRNSGVDTRKTGRLEWMGDKIDISIGRGKVRLLYDDESYDVFRRKLCVDAAVKEKKRWWKFGKGLKNS